MPCVRPRRRRSTYYAFRLEARPYGDTGSTPYGTGSTAPPAWRLPLQAVVVAMDPTRATSCYGVVSAGVPGRAGLVSWGEEGVDARMVG